MTDEAPESTETDLTESIAKLERKNAELIGKQKKLTSLMAEKDTAMDTVMAQMKSDEEKRLMAAGKFDEVANLRQEHQRVEMATMLAERDRDAERMQREMDGMSIGMAAQEAAMSAGVLANMTEMVGLLVKDHYRLEDGKIIGYRNGEALLNEKGEILTMQEFVEQLATTKPALFGSKRGAGATGRHGGMPSPDPAKMSREEKSAYVEKHGDDAYLSLIKQG